MLEGADKQVDCDPYQCRCGPCRGFWKKKFKDSAPLLEKPSVLRAVDTGVMFGPVLNREDHPAVISIGDRVIVKGKHQGIVKFIGLLDNNVIAPETYVGVHLDENVHSASNGIFRGKRYFYCPKGHGAFAKYSDIRAVNPPDKRPPLYGNYMFNGYAEIQRRRKERQQALDPLLRDADSASDSPDGADTSGSSQLTNKSFPTGLSAQQVRGLGESDAAKNNVQKNTRKDKRKGILQKLQEAYQEGLKVKHETHVDLDLDDEY